MVEERVHSAKPRRRLRRAFDSAATLAMIVAAGATLWNQGVGRDAPPVLPTLPVNPVSIAGANRIGSPSADIIVIAYMDYQCGSCRTFERDVFPRLEMRYIDTGQVLWVFRHRPLRTHASAMRAAEAVECSGRQGKFAEAHHRLLKSDLAPAVLLELAGDLGIDAVQFGQCLEGEARSVIQQDIAVAARLGIAVTPTFLIGRKLPDGRVEVTTGFSGVAPVRAFRRALDRALRKPLWWLPWPLGLDGSTTLLLRLPAHQNDVSRFGK